MMELLKRFEEESAAEPDLVLDDPGDDLAQRLENVDLGASMLFYITSILSLI